MIGGKGTYYNSPSARLLVVCNTRLPTFCFLYLGSTYYVLPSVSVILGFRGEGYRGEFEGCIQLSYTSPLHYRNISLQIQSPNLLLY
jgi:hypothetical protein